MLLDPAGFRWLNETWLKVDRGVRFYNTASIPPDPGFLVSRAVMVVLGLGAASLASATSPRPLAARPRERHAERRRPASERVSRSRHRPPRGPRPSSRFHWPRFR